MKHLLINKYFTRNVSRSSCNLAWEGHLWLCFFSLSNIECVILSLMINTGFRVSITGQHEIKRLWIYMSTRHSIDQRLCNLNLRERLPMLCDNSGHCWLWWKKFENRISNSNRGRVLSLLACNYIQVLVDLTTGEHLFAFFPFFLCVFVCPFISTCM